MELDELHVLQRQARAQHHAIAVTGTRMGRGAGEVGASVAARRQNRHVRAKTVQLALVHVQGHDAAARPVLHDQIDREVLDEKSSRVLDGLLVQGVQHRVTGAIRGRARAMRGALAEVRRHAAEGSLIDPAFGGTRERQSVVLELDDGRRRLLAHELDGVLVAEPVRPFHGVVHVPAPVVLTHVPERGADASLRGDGVTSCREQLGEAGCRKTRLRQTERRAQAGAACPDDDDVVSMVDERVGAHAPPPKATFRTANTPAAAMRVWTKVMTTSVSVFAPLWT